MSNEENNLQDYLRMVDNFTKGLSIESVTLKHGKEFPSPAVARPKHLKKGRDKECFKNAYHVCVENAGFKYVEGFATSIIPVHHAWVLDKDDNVVETTWQEAGEEYFGIVIPIPWVNKVIVETGVYGALNPVSKTFTAKYYPEIKKS
jgi:hypothetical protein